MSEQSTILAPEDERGSPPLVPLQTSAAISSARAEVESSLLIAKRFPRNERDCAARLKRACQRLGMAESATYKFKRGEEVEGPSVYLARQAKICWTNMDAGFRALERTDEETLVEGYAIDRETNSTSRYQQRVKNLIQRSEWTTDGEGNRAKVTKWVKPDERDYIELVARTGAKLERNAIFAIIPQDIIDDAVRESKKTLMLESRGKLEQSRDEVVVNLLASFDQHGVTREDMERRLGHKLETINEQELTDLRRIYKSIDDGQATVAEFFSTSTPAAGAADTKASDVKARVEAAKKEAADKAAAEKAAAGAAQTGASAPPADQAATAAEPPKADPNKPATTKQRQRLIAVSRDWMAATGSTEEDGRNLVREFTGFANSDTSQLTAVQLDALMAKMEAETKAAKQQ